MVKQRNLDKDGRVNLIKIINTSHSKFYQIIRVILLTLILLIQSLAEEKKKLLPLKELISREGFWADTGSIKYFCMRCSGLYFFTVTASDINKPLDKGDLKKIKKGLKIERFISAGLSKCGKLLPYLMMVKKKGLKTMWI